MPRRLFLLVSAVVLVDTSFFAAVAPLLPEYANDLGLSKTGAGILTAAYPAGAFVGAVPGGWLAARWGVKPTLLLGISVVGVSSLVFGFANTAVVLDAARFVQGVGSAGMWAAGMAWLVAMAPPDRRGAVLGSALGVAIIGVLIGPVLGGAAVVVGPEIVFSAVAVFAGGLAVWASTMRGVAPRMKRPLASFAVAFRRPALRASLWLFTLPAMFAGAVEVLTPLRLDLLGASGVTIGAIFLVTAGVEAVLSPVAGRLSDRHGRLAPIRAGLLAGVVMAALLPLPTTVLLLGAAVMLSFAAIGWFWAPALAMLADASDDAGVDQALSFSFSNLGWSTGHILGAGVGGALAEATADAVVYGLLGVTCALTFVWVTSLARRTPATTG